MNETLNLDCIELVTGCWGTMVREAQKFFEAQSESLESALGACHRLNQATGFVKDDLKSARRYLLKNPKSRYPTFLAQHNPRRKDRFAGAGRVQPPEGIRPKNANCPFCNTLWQQFGTEIPYRYSVANETFDALPNAFPFGDVHFTHAAVAHRPQSWCGTHKDETLANLQNHIVCAVEHAVATPRRIVIINDKDAGASIAEHFHLQSLLRPDGYGYWPLEIAAAQARGASSTAEALLVADYPIASVHWCGAKEAVLAHAREWAERWLKASGWKPTLRAHIISAARIDSPECVQLYIVPRDSPYPHSALMEGTVGSLEVLGEFVFWTDDELKKLNTGQIDHSTAVEILASVEPRGQREVLKEICA